MEPQYVQGQEVKNYRVKKVVKLEEINAILYEIEHTPTGAHVIHIETDDPENVFNISFRTYPYSDDGVAHILEHTVLCGSQKFPVKDPFFSMNRRSLNTFMNAFTGSDFTCYPAASQVEKDFYNLLEVYLDATFHPQLKELSFLQEGHRLEFDKSDDPSSPLTYKGIVFNEMKGALNSADARLWHALQAKLYPENIYKYNSGGDPKEIPNLTYEQLKEFHQTYYHPSQALFYFYGNFDLNKHLDFIEEKVLKGVKKQKPLAKIAEQPKAKKRQKVKMSYPSNEDNTLIAFGWVTAPITDTLEALALTVLDSVLMDSDASLLKSALQESKLTVQADGFIETDMSQIPYTIICRGCDEEKANDLEKLLIQTLKKIAKKGIPEKSIENTLQQFELTRSEISKDGGPYGLSLFMRAGLLWQHGGNPEDNLKVHTLFDQLREKIKEENYFSDLIKKHLIDNSSYVRLIMTPNNELAAQEKADEEAALEKINKLLDKVEKEKIVGTALQLAKFQEESEEGAIDCLPSLTKNDIPKKAVDFPLKYEGVNQLGLYHHDTFTNNITYADIVFDLYDTPMEELHLLKLFTSIITELGCGIRNYKETLEFSQAFTGGLSCYVSLNPLYDKPEVLRPTLALHGYALERYTDHLFNLMKDTILMPNLDDKERIKELILQTYTLMSDKLNRNAMGYATKGALAPLSEHNTIVNEMSGLPYFQFIRGLALNIDKVLDEVVAKLCAVKEKLFHLNNPHFVITSNRKTIDYLHEKEFYKFTRIPSSPFSPWVGNYQPEKAAPKGKLISSPVAFTSKAYPVFDYSHPLCPALYLATFIMENRVLHKMIREQGGAYGSGASYQPNTGNFYFYAYRDPNLASTLKAFDAAIDYVAKGKFNEADMLEAFLGLIQGFDTPVSPGARGSATYYFEKRNRTYEVRQAFREAALSTTKEQIVEAVNEALVGKEKLSNLNVYSSKEFFDGQKGGTHLDISEV